MSKEYWVPIQEWDPYLLSNHGRVNRIGRASGAKIHRILKGGVNRNGYEFVILRDRGRKWCVEIHVLMALHFIGPRPKGKWIDHIDGTKRNNRVENLRYCTPSENMRNAVAQGKIRYYRGAEHPRKSRKLPDRSIKAIKRRAAKGVRVCEIAKHYPQVRYNAVWSIVRGRTWQHIDAS